MAVINKDADVVLLFNTLFGIYDNGNHSTGTLETFDELLEVEANTQGEYEKYYSATGKKRKKIIGDASTYVFRMKKTADLVDTAFPPTNIRTISFWQHKIMVLREHVEGALEFLQEAESASNKFLHEQAIVNIERITDVRNPDTGALEVEIECETLDFIKNRREAT